MIKLFQDTTVKGFNMTLDEQINELGMANGLADVLREIDLARRPEITLESSYISVRPAGRHIAAYFNKQHVDIAVEPLSSAASELEHPGTRAFAKTNATHYLRVPEGAADTEAVIRLVGAALDWRDQGHQWSGTRTEGGQQTLQARSARPATSRSPTTECAAASDIQIRGHHRPVGCGR